jgi:hypothetical protein
MKIGVITHWLSHDNYGQQLQCYALQQYLLTLGHNPYLIRFTYTTRRQLIKQKIKRILALFVPKYKVNFRMERIVKLRHFEDFRLRYIQISNRQYRRSKDLIAHPPEADCYIVGSDVVWGFYLHNDEVLGWFLHFGNPSVRRISYAASMGRKLQENDEERFLSLTRKLDAISVREDSLRKDCERIGLKNVSVVLDPTLLLSSDMYPICGDCSTVDYLFLYILNVETADEFYWTKIEQYISTHHLVARFVFSSRLALNKLGQVFKNEQLTIPQWLAAVRDARCIVTNSYHGVIFSILFHKPFLAILFTNHRRGLNHRIVDLLYNLDLSDRIYNPERNLDRQIEAPINWTHVDSLLSVLRNDSADFLKDNLQE